MWYKTRQGVEIHHVDVLSLYLYTCKYGEFPMGHPTVYVGADCPAKCLERELSNVRFWLLRNCIMQ